VKALCIDVVASFDRLRMRHFFVLHLQMPCPLYLILSLSKDAWAAMQP